MDPITDPSPTTPPQRFSPKWWTESIESSWSAAKKDALADWDKLAAAQKELTLAVAEEAIAFGHGARDRFQKFQVWGAELEAKLESDWKDGHQTAHAWEKVKDAVRHGWKRAADVTKSAPPGSGKP